MATAKNTGRINVWQDEAAAIEVGGAGSKALRRMRVWPTVTQAKANKVHNLAPRKIKVHWADGFEGGVVPEDTSTSTVLGTLSATDPEGDAVTFALQADPDSKFALDGVDLILDAALDYETATSHSFTIRANDGNGGLTDHSFAITVGDVDEGGGGGYTASAVHFDDGSAQLTNADPTVSNSPYLLASFWTNSEIYFLRGQFGDYIINSLFLDPVSRLSVLVTDETESIVFAFHADVQSLSDGNWHSVQIAVDTNHPAGEKIGLITVDRVSQTLVVEDDAGSAFDIMFSGLSCKCPNGSVGDGAEFFCAMGQFLDISQAANINKFSSASNKPVSLGADGSLPTGTAPTIFFSGDADNFTMNKGTGGGFTLTGTLANASTSPSD